MARVRHMTGDQRGLSGVHIAIGFLTLATFMLTGAQAADKTSTGQKLLAVDWDDPELTAVARSHIETAGIDSSKFAPLRVPVLAFTEVPQIVRNVAGPKAKRISPRRVVLDAQQPYWYHIDDIYEGVTVSVSADRRINHDVSGNFQIGAAKSGAEATLGTNEHPKISILDGSTEEGMEGVIIEYTLQKFPDIPYTITIECSKAATAQCKDLSVIAKDEALLKVVSLGQGK